MRNSNPWPLNCFRKPGVEHCIVLSSDSVFNWAEAECLSAVTSNFEQNYCRLLYYQRCRLDLCLYSHQPHSVSWVRLWRGAVAPWWWCSTAWWPTTIGCWWRASTCTACWSSPCSARGSTSTFTWLLAGVRTTTVTQWPSHINAVVITENNVL